MANEKSVSKIKTYDDACKKLKLDPKIKRNDWDKLEIIAEALQGKFVADFSNRNQDKWYPWFKLSGSRFVFVDAYYAYEHAYAASGPRLAMPTYELAKYFGTQFENEWNEVLTKKKRK